MERAAGLSAWVESPLYRVDRMGHRHRWAQPGRRPQWCLDCLRPPPSDRRAHSRGCGRPILAGDRTWQWRHQGLRSSRHTGALPNRVGERAAKLDACLPRGFANGRGRSSKGRVGLGQVVPYGYIDLIDKLPGAISRNASLASKAKMMVRNVRRPNPEIAANAVSNRMAKFMLPDRVMGRAYE